MGRDYNAEKQKIIKDMLAKGASKIQAEQISNDQVNASKQGPSAFEQVKEDEGAIAAQHQTMSRYKEMADNGGFTAADSAAQNQASKQVSQQDNARRQGILQEMQARGQAGSGNELAMRLASADSAGAQNADASQQIAARGEAKRDNAIAASGQLAGQMRSQTAQTQNNLAQGRDSVSRFNADLTGRTMMQNNNNTNQANQYNAGATERFDNHATDIQYNSTVDDQRTDMAEKAARDAKKKGRMGAMLGVAGAVAGGVIGTMAAPGLGTAAGATIGSQLGSSVGSNFAHGGKVKGIELVEGDDEANDLIPTMLSANEIVIPKSKTTPEKAAAFVAKINGDDEEAEEDDSSIEEAILMIAKALATMKGKK